MLTNSFPNLKEQIVNLSRAFCDPRPRSYQIMSSASSKLLKWHRAKFEGFTQKSKEFYNFRKWKYFQIYGPSFQYRIYHQITNMTCLYYSLFCLKIHSVIPMYMQIMLWENSSIYSENSTILSEIWGPWRG
jgi:hypothetical protein